MTFDQRQLASAAGALRCLGIAAATCGGMAVSLLVMVGVAGTDLPDGALVGLASVCSIAVMIWGKKGAEPLPKWLMVSCLLPSMMLGICLLMGSYERYPLFSPWLMGTLATLGFVVIGLATSWRSISSAEDFSVEGAPNGQLGKLVSAIFVFIFSGVLFFQPILVLLNGQSQSRPPLVIAGTVAQAYETHGKGAANYLVLTGPAAAFHSTWTAGEFEVDWTTYRSSPVGSSKCLTIRTGILRFRWWSISDC